MDSTLQRIARAMLRGGGAAPALNPPLATAPPPVSPADFQRLGAPPAAAGTAANPVQMPPVTAAASPLPQEAPPTGATPYATAPPADLIPPSLAGAPNVAPGMARVPQNAADLDAWRKMMDAFQFVRQGQ